MISTQLRRFGAAAIALTLVSPAFATNGYFTHGTGTNNKAMAGAGLASPTGSISVANNPAAALIGVGQFEFGGAIFNPQRSYSTSASQANGNGGAFTVGPNELDSKGEIFLIPYVSYGWQMDESSAIGAAFYGRGGMNTEWRGGSATFDPDGPGPTEVSTLPGTFGAGKTGVDLKQAFLDIAYAKKLNEKFTWGLSGVVAVQAFQATGVANFAPFTESFAASGGTSFPSNLTNNDTELSTGVGFKLGVHIEVNERVSVAASYQSRIAMSEFDDYSDLFAESGGFDIPATTKLGITVHASEKVALSADLEHTQFSDVASVGNPFSNLFACPTVDQNSTALGNCLGGSNGPGFGWDDMTTLKLGVSWASSDEWTWRAGYSHGSQPISSSEVLFNILAPAVIEDHLSVGFTRTMSNYAFNAALTHALENSVSGPNPLDPTQTVELEMHQFELELSFTKRF